MIFEHAVRIVHAVAGGGDDGQQAGVVGQLGGEPFVDGLFLLIVGHAVGDHLAEHVLGHIQRLLVAVGELGGIAGTVGVGDLFGGADRIFARDDYVVLSGNVLAGAVNQLLQQGIVGFILLLQLRKDRGGIGQLLLHFGPGSVLLLNLFQQVGDTPAEKAHPADTDEDGKNEQHGNQAVAAGAFGFLFRHDNTFFHNGQAVSPCLGRNGRRKVP